MNPAAIEQAKALKAENYQVTKLDLEQARVQNEWHPTSEVFPQLSPQVLKKVVKPPPEYKGLNRDNEELSNLLEKF